MNIRKQLETEHSKRLTLRIVNYVGDDKTKLKELVGIFLSGDNRLSQRAAWPLGDIGTGNPKLFRPFVPKLIDKLKEPGLHPAIPRNILRIFQTGELDEKHRAELFDLCFTFLVNESQAIATRAFAISVTTRIAATYPELQKELLIVFRDLAQLPQTPAIRSRLKYALKELTKAVPSF